jgi:sugar lactone lactonase YvrE
VTRDTQVLTDGWTFLEGPRWHDGRIWASDFYTNTLFAVTLDGDVERLAHVEGQSSGLGWLPDGDAVLVSMKDQRLLRLHDGELSHHADLSGVLSGLVNDMVVDRNGRAYVGSFGFDLFTGEAVRPSAIAVVEPDGAARVAAEDMLFPNGPVITPDGTTLIVAESFGQRLSAFTIQEDGSLTDRRTWADLSAAAGPEGRAVVPDGTTLDAEGCIWVADASAGRAVRVREGGEVVDEVAVDEGIVYACALAGDDGRTLVLCTAPTSDPAEAAAARGARLVTCTVDVPHAGLP